MYLIDTNMYEIYIKMTLLLTYNCLYISNIHIDILFEVNVTAID